MTRTKGTELTNIALEITKLSHALLPPDSLAIDPSQDGHGQRHPMRIQAVLARLTPLHRPIHALGGLDLRRGGTHASRIREDPRGGGSRRVARSHGEQIERDPR